MKNKRCSKCKEEKLLSEFHKNKAQNDGYNNYCKECDKIRQKKYYQDNKIFVDKKHKIKRNKNRWWGILSDIKRRCNNKNFKHYKYYGGRGIQALISSSEIKELWFRDKAYLMKRPSIDRINNDGNYIYENCRFIEQSENTIKMVKNRREDDRK